MQEVGLPPIALTFLLPASGMVVLLLILRSAKTPSDPRLNNIQAMSDKPNDQIINEINFIGEREVMQNKARELGYGFADLDRVTVDPKTLALLPRELVERHRVIPVKQQDNSLWLAMSNPADKLAIEEVSKLTNCRVIPVMAVPSAIDEAIAKYYDS